MGIEHRRQHRRALPRQRHAQRRPFAVANKTNFNDAEFSELFLQAMAQPDLEKRKRPGPPCPAVRTSAAACIWGYADLLDGFSTRVGGAHEEQTLFSTWRFESLWLNGTA